MQHLLSKMRRAVDDYGMIQDGDRIAVGLSGGKDSLAVLVAAKALQRFYPNRFHLEAITLDMGTEGMDFSPLRQFCEDLDVPFHLEKTEIKQIVFDWRKEKSPCSLCANLRRGALNTAALDRGLTKIMLGHHHDDVIETFMMSQIFEGRISCFSPVTYLDRKDVSVIRPMIYVTESDVNGLKKRFDMPVIESSCPADGNTKRQYIKETIRSLEKENPGIKERLFGAVARSSIDGWKKE